MINIAVIDDERVVRDQIVDKVKSMIQGLQAEVFSYGDAASFFDAMDGEKARFHIVISDIRMQGMNGIELGRRLRKNMPEVYLIYLTSSSDYAVESYILDAYQYVLKRDMDSRLPEILQVVLKKVAQETKKYMVVGGVSHQQKVCFDDIVCIYKVKGTKYVAYETTSETLRDRKTLDQVMAETQDCHFVLIERGHVINLAHVMKIKENTLTLSNGAEWVVSRTRIQQVRDALNRYWGAE